jgi:hypothetical protein
MSWPGPGLGIGGPWTVYVLTLPVAAFRFRAPAWTSTPGNPWVAFAVARLRPPVFPLAAGALITYCRLGLKTATEAGATAIFEQSALMLVTVALLVVTALRVRTSVSVLKVH